MAHRRPERSVRLSRVAQVAASSLSTLTFGFASQFGRFLGTESIAPTHVPGCELTFDVGQQGPSKAGRTYGNMPAL